MWRVEDGEARTQGSLGRDFIITTGLLRRRDVQESPGQAWLTRVGLTVFDGRDTGGDSTTRTASTAQTASKLVVKVSLDFPDSGTYKLN